MVAKRNPLPCNPELRSNTCKLQIEKIVEWKERGKSVGSISQDTLVCGTRHMASAPISKWDAAGKQPFFAVIQSRPSAQVDVRYCRRCKVKPVLVGGLHLQCIPGNFLRGGRSEGSATDPPSCSGSRCPACHRRTRTSSGQRRRTSRCAGT